jgi:hypothetical protein
MTLRALLDPCLTRNNPTFGMSRFVREVFGC